MRFLNPEMTITQKSPEVVFLQTCWQRRFLVWISRTPEIKSLTVSASVFLPTGRLSASSNSTNKRGNMTIKRKKKHRGHCLPLHTTSYWTSLTLSSLQAADFLFLYITPALLHSLQTWKPVEGSEEGFFWTTLNKTFIFWTCFISEDQNVSGGFGPDVSAGSLLLVYHEEAKTCLFQFIFQLFWWTSRNLFNGVHMNH